MKINQIMLRANWLGWIILALLSEIIITGGFLASSYFLDRQDYSTLSYISLVLAATFFGAPSCMIFKIKSEFNKKTQQLEKMYRIKNLFSVTPKHLTKSIPFKQLEKEIEK